MQMVAAGDRGLIYDKIVVEFTTTMSLPSTW